MNREAVVLAARTASSIPRVCIECIHVQRFSILHTSEVYVFMLPLQCCCDHWCHSAALSGKSNPTVFVPLCVRCFLLSLVLMVGRRVAAFLGNRSPTRRRSASETRARPANDVSTLLEILSLRTRWLILC
jgi:hypothetical protein